MIQEDIPVPVEDDHDQILQDVEQLLAWREKPTDDRRDKQT